jgi:hypothetical protein
MKNHPVDGIGRYIGDFVCHEARLIIEVGGGQHDRSSCGEARAPIRAVAISNSTSAQDFPPSQLRLEAATAVVRLHRDWGDGGNRRHARLKGHFAFLDRYSGRPITASSCSV